MPSLLVADSHQVDSVYRESHALWGAGLSTADYREFWRELQATDWGTRHSAFLVWLGIRDEILSSLKIYRLPLRLDGRTYSAVVLGAIFTPAESRRQGHAAEMVRALLHQIQEEGDCVAMLFSDIGTRYYEELGFQRLPAEEQWGTLPVGPVATRREWTLRPMMPSDLPSIIRAHHDFCLQQPLAVIRDEAHWEFLKVRSKSFFDRLGDPELRFGGTVALNRGEFAGYLIDVRGHGEWNLREVGAVGGDPETMATVLRLGAAQAREEGLHSFYGWIPSRVARRLTDWNIRSGPRRRALPMIRIADGTPALSSLGSNEEVFIPFQDQF